MPIFILLFNIVPYVHIYVVNVVDNFSQFKMLQIWEVSSVGLYGVLFFGFGDSVMKGLWGSAPLPSPWEFLG